MPVPCCMLLECLLNISHGNSVSVGIPVQETVTTDRYMREDKTSERNIRLYSSGRADTEDIEGPMFRLHLPSLEIYIGESVKFVHHDIYIVRTDTCRKCCHSDALILSGHRDEFTRLVAEFLLFKILSNHIYTTGIPYQNHIVGKFFGTKMEMEHRSVTIDDKFRFSYSHNVII